MKKIMISLMALLSVSMTAFAEGNEVESVNRYNFNVNNNSMSKYLSLSDDQRYMSEYIMREFSNDMTFVGMTGDKMSRDTLATNAIDKNVRHMAMILDKEQLRKYLTVLNVTLNNKGIETIRK